MTHNSGDCAETDNHEVGDRQMNNLLWITQLLLAGVFLVSGYRKIFLYDKPSGSMLPSPSVVPRRAASLIGTLEILAAIGLVLPWLLGVLRWLTPLAALGCAILMVLAAGFHMVRREYTRTAIPALLCVLALFVAYGRS